MKDVKFYDDEGSVIPMDGYICATCNCKSFKFSHIK